MVFLLFPGRDFYIITISKNVATVPAGKGQPEGSPFTKT
jgi:hypothetical protein